MLDAATVPEEAEYEAGSQHTIQAVEKSVPAKVVLAMSYDSFAYSGFERSRGESTVEGDLLAALSSLSAIPRNKKHLKLSKTSNTDAGVHALRQMQGVLDTPHFLESLNQLLPEQVRVWGLVQATSDFSARRNCDTQSWTYLLPTYVFHAPSTQTHYHNPAREDEDVVHVVQVPIEESRGVLRSLSRRVSRSSRVATKYRNGHTTQPTSPMYDTMDDKTGRLCASAPLSPVAIDDEPTSKVPPKSQEKGFIATLKRITSRRGRRSRSSDNLKSPTTSSYIPRIYTPYANGVLGGQAADPLDEIPVTLRRKDSVGGLGSPGGPSGGSEDGIISTLRRTLSRRDGSRAGGSLSPGPRSRSQPARSAPGGFVDESSENVFQQSLKDMTAAAEPLNLAEPTAEDLQIMREFRATPLQLKALNHIMGIYRGTHNWHNYTRGGIYDDMPYERVLNCEASAPEYYNGMEWVRITISARSFEKYQIVKMIALAVLVIRTNTPRSVVANSFGRAKIDIPEIPGYGLLLEDASYDSYNSEIARLAAASPIVGDLQPVTFEPFRDHIEEFQRTLCKKVVSSEYEKLGLLDWTRAIDKYSFLYTSYLNPRGIIDLSEFWDHGVQ
ncbi:hypothetical protein SeMB42_g00009 [Synchytrium endobioticum]|uniref:Pseudouridine synthase I TruA alpha/beta domain-containing protein n=1 Tax=Synchytrium endobioticum TaxID=286115 RepID=A0A507DUW4_9FUNG|nr:hypothetical protein SeLEV6574_g02068 [Synchytrium endobioticum]TPX54995.1 hypothetical protein SeMB42_g00009 [Synchytrium endobioticum]